MVWVIVWHCMPRAVTVTGAAAILLGTVPAPPPPPPPPHPAAGATAAGPRADTGARTGADAARANAGARAGPDAAGTCTDATRAADASASREAGIGAEFHIRGQRRKQDKRRDRREKHARERHSGFLLRGPHDGRSVLALFDQSATHSAAAMQRSTDLVILCFRGAGDVVKKSRNTAGLGARSSG